jgi:hypothetical protein
MAAITALTANFQARDWEFLMGLIGPTTDPDFQDILTKLRNFYESQGTRPQGNTVINVATVEQAVVQMFSRFLEANAGISQTTNQQPYTRIRAAVLAMNNVADNWIQTTVADLETVYDAAQANIRKTGRKSIMMKTYDSN